jgi:acetyl esterase/lipase
LVRAAGQLLCSTKITGKLKNAGVEVTATRYNGMIHDFVLLNTIHDVAGVQAALGQASDAIRDALKQ